MNGNKNWPSEERVDRIAASHGDGEHYEILEMLDKQSEGEKMDLIELQNMIHRQNVELGWWDEDRPFSTFACLFHSELSEAMEGDRKTLMDDHLPDYEMFWVELADFAIRCMDWLGSCKNVSAYKVRPVTRSRLNALAVLHCCVSDAFSHSEDGRAESQKDSIIEAVEMSLGMAEWHSVDIIGIIKQKVAYNKNRADHKRENRAKDGGKKY